MDDLCKICRKIFTRKETDDDDEYPHHRSIHDLIKKSNSGCRLCNFVWSKFSEQEKLLVGVGLEEPVSLEPRSISYELDSGSWESAIECAFHFPTSNSKHIEKVVAFLQLDDPDYRSPTHQNRHRFDPKNMLSVFLGQDTSTGSASSLERANLGQDTNTGSAPSLEFAKGWITTCVQKHLTCTRMANSKKSKLPARLLWVDPSENGPLRLCDTHNLPHDTQYTTLSHCWGETKFLSLTTKNIDKFRTGIRCEDLAKTFQDAIRVTRFMSIRYIWIDSLCIIQDLAEDWQTATYACNGEIGCFVNRSIKGSQLTIKIPSRNKQNDYIFTPGRYECRYPNLWEEEVTNSVLLQRAWVFQERILAPRVLHFSSHQMFFECQEFRASELYPEDMELPTRVTDGWLLGDTFKQTIHSMLTKAMDILPIDKNSVSRRRLIARVIWMYMLNNFTACKLTRETDRLIAISGLAHLLQPLLDCRYLAGLWEDNLVVQLMWRNDSESIRTKTYQAPSWSWASRSGSILFYDSNMRDVAERGWYRHDFEESCRELVRVCDVEVANKDGDPMGHVTHGRLRLKGILIPTMIGPDPKSDYDNPGGQILRMRDVKVTLRQDISGEKLIGRFFCVMCLHTTICLDGYSEYAQGLLLRSTGIEKGQYQRVGHIATTWGNETISQICTPLNRDQQEMGIMTDDFYEEYDTDTEQYTFTII